MTATTPIKTDIVFAEQPLLKSTTRPVLHFRISVERPNGSRRLLPGLVEAYRDNPGEYKSLEGFPGRTAEDRDLFKSLADFDGRLNATVSGINARRP